MKESRPKLSQRERVARIPVESKIISEATPSMNSIGSAAQTYGSNTGLVAVTIIMVLLTLFVSFNRYDKATLDREFQKTLEWERQRGTYR